MKEFLCDYAQLKERLEEMNIQASVGGRPKHVYSIYGKMSQQDKTFDQIYDLLAVRVIVHTVRDCYAVLGMVHTHWKPIPGRFKDYIAVPKENLYQSLHTTLVGQKGVPFEVQIRTWDMHRTAEYGIAAHWQYKENQAGRAQSEQDETKFKWLRSILEWQSDTRDAKEFMDTLKMDLFNDEIFVFTPKSAVISLPRGATPIDFAYYIHSAVGNRCVGAKINGRMQPLDTQLQTGDIVEIITSNSTRGPSRDWLKMVKSPQARSKIRAWFRKEFKEENIERGRTMMEEAAKKHAIALNDLLKNEFLRKIYRRYTLSSLDDLYAAVGCGGMPASQVVARLVEEHKLALREAQRRALEELLKTQGAAPGAPAAAAPAADEGMEVSVRGQRGMLVRYSLCCNPRSGDDIVGFITRGRGVSVHRRDCPNIGNMLQDASRIVPVEWVRSNQKTEHRAAFRLTAPDGDGLFVRISNAISSHQLRLVEVNAKVGPHDMAEMTFTVEWKEEQQLRDLEQTLQNLPEIHQVQQIG